VYIGGIYEVTKNAAGTLTNQVKYYQGLGRTIALRLNGALYYPTVDQLGSTVGMMDIFGNMLAGSKTQYWPYGATRSATQSAFSDRLFTGQQKEPDGDPLGLYDYKARFYSTLTGRFVSADPVSILNRYAYAADAPTEYFDPSGLYLQLVCGWGQTCRHGNGGVQYGGDIEHWRTLTIGYWKSGSRGSTSAVTMST
jgi:RHS repeat-associated protein